MMSLPPLGSNWPFPSVNGEQTPDSKELEAQPQPRPLTAYESVMSEPDTEESPL